MSTTIEGKFRRVKRLKRGEKVRTGKVETLAGAGASWGDPEPVSIPIGVQAWEYLNQDKVQTESVAITGSNNPSAMENNVFWQLEQDARYGMDVAVDEAQKVLDKASSIGITGLTGFVILGIIYFVFVRGK